jgi:5'-methylthioadenosine phosphorylase
LEWEPGTLVACSDLLDLTGRRQTLFSRDVRHTDMTHPFPARDFLLDAAKAVGEDLVNGGVYLSADGPRYETPQEIKMMATLGGELVGMTAATEAILMREAGVPYACLAIVTNLAAGLSAHELHHGEVEDMMKERGAKVVEILLRAASLA